MTFDRPRKLTALETLRLGFALGEPFLAAGHPPTCNGGNDNIKTHHDHEVIMLLAGRERLVCPECGREQWLPSDWNYDDEDSPPPRKRSK